jgi:hypothetical protein
MPSPTPRRPDPPPFQTNEYAPVITAVAMWVIAFFVLLVLHHRMAARGAGWWLWVSVGGFVIGLWGLTMLTLRRRSQRRRATAESVEIGLEEK